MDRQIVYPGSIPLDTDVLNVQRNTLKAIGYALQMTLGQGTFVDGLALTATSPASMSVNVGPGSIVTLAEVDPSAFGSLPADANPLMKMGINAEGSTSFALTAPTTSGQSRNYLISAQFSETTATPVTLPYYNAANPAQPFTGPANSGTPQDTQVLESVALQLIPGTPAAAGTQTTPAVPAGCVGLYVITVNFGQTKVTSSSCTIYPTAPFLPFKLPQLVPGFTRMAVFIASQTWTVPAGVTLGRVTVVGGGGGGGGGASGFGGAGGGAGGATIGPFALPNATYAITIGAGGVGGGATAAGTQGGTSSFGSLASATGGGGGIGAAATAAGGSGGAGLGGALDIGGGLGSDGNGGGVTLAGNGGNSLFGGGGRAAAGGDTAAQNGQAPGAGGGGCYAVANNGGNGAAGIVIVEY